MIFYFRRETIRKEEEAQRAWNEKFDPWLIDEYREVRFFYKSLNH